MDRKLSGPSVSKALVGNFTKVGEGLSPGTLRTVRHRLRQWTEFVGYINVSGITPNYMHASLP